MPECWMCMRWRDKNSLVAGPLYCQQGSENLLLMVITRLDQVDSAARATLNRARLPGRRPDQAHTCDSAAG